MLVEYYSEQVSHHPPIAAYYCLNRRKKVFYYGSEQLIGSFTGTALKANYRGFQKVYLAEWKETYEIKMPTWYLRGILIGKPFVDFQGEAIITCQETGFVAKIDFLEKFSAIFSI